MEEAGALVLAAFGLVMLGAVSHFIRNATASGTLGRNSVIGLRTKVTQSSEVAWTVGHRAAGPWLLACAWAGYGTGAATVAGAVIAIVLGAVPVALWGVAVAGFVAVVALVIRATAVANTHGGHAASEAP